MAIWRNKVELRKHLSEETDNQTILNILNVLIPQLEAILTKERNTESLKMVTEDLLEKFIEVIGEFNWIKASIENEVDCSEFGYEDWCEAFNNYLTELYDIGDSSPDGIYRVGGERFLWVG